MNDGNGAAEKNIRINFSKGKTKFCSSLHYNGDESYFYVNKTEICKIKANNNISWYNFCLQSVSKYFTKDEWSKIYLNGTVYDFSVDQSSIEITTLNIRNIHQYLMVKNNVKKYLRLLKNVYWVIN